MNETRELLSTLKLALRGQGKTYTDVAQHLDLSEASVKRLLSNGRLSLERLEKICELLDLSLVDLMAQLKKQRLQLHALTPEQEQTLASDHRLLLLAYLLLNHWSVEEVLQEFDFERHEITRKLAQLDRMRLIELLPNNQIKLNISRHFHWQANGPIEEFFEKQVQSDFLQSRFRQPGEYRSFVSGMLSRKANAVIQERLKELEREVVKLMDQDESLPLADRFGTGLVLALRPWEPAVFGRLRKANRNKKF